MDRRLLLVEDEVHLAFSVEFNLQEEGYQVDVAHTLAEARGLMASATYALIILDVMLPDGDGVAFCAELRQAQDYTPVLMLTAKGSSEDIVTGLDAGADDYMTKPFALQELLGRISAMLRRHRWGKPEEESPASGGTFAFGPHVIDFEAHRATSHGQPVEITELELRLLRYFVEHQDKAISRQTLLEEVWQVSGTNNTRTVDNFLVRLRRLFEEDPSRPAHFLTVRGIGYRFVSVPEHES